MKIRINYRGLIDMFWRKKREKAKIPDMLKYIRLPFGCRFRRLHTPPLPFFDPSKFVSSQMKLIFEKIEDEIALSFDKLDKFERELESVLEKNNKKNQR